MSLIDKTNKLDKWPFTEFEMPSIWYEEDAIYNLMQTFKRPREIDPTSYDFKINFWTNLIEKYAFHHHLIVFSEAELQTIFTKEFKSHGLSVKPQCLSTVLYSMQMAGKIMPISQFDRGSILNQVASGIGWLVRTPLQWSYGAISSVLFGTERCNPTSIAGPTIEMVALGPVERCVPEFLGWFVSNTEPHILSAHHDLVPRLSFLTMLADYFRDTASRTLAQQLLLARGLIAFVSVPPESGSGKATGSSDIIELVRFARSSDAPLANWARGPLDRQTADQIRGLAQLRALFSRLEADEALLEHKLSTIKATVKACLRVKNIEEAKKHLKRGKSIEKVLERKRAQLQNVETMLMEIETSSDNVQVMNALSGAAGALRARSLDLDSVQEIMAEVGDTLADHEEISTSLATGFGGSLGADALAELESDLSQLLAIDDAEKLDALLDTMPEAPKGSISPQKWQRGSAYPSPVS